MMQEKHEGAENPFAWPDQTEVDLGNGVYGYRREVTFGTTTAANTKSQFNLGANKNEIIAIGGWWDMGDGLKTAIGSDTSGTTLTSSATGAVRICITADATMCYHVSSIDRAVGTKMNVWIKYTK